MTDQVLCLTNRRTREQVSSSPSEVTAWLHAEQPYNLCDRTEVGDSQIHGEFPFSNGATVSGKPWMAGALMNAAIRAGFKAKY